MSRESNDNNSNMSIKIAANYLLQFVCVRRLTKKFKDQTFKCYQIARCAKLA